MLKIPIRPIFGTLVRGLLSRGGEREINQLMHKGYEDFA